MTTNPLPRDQDFPAADSAQLRLDWLDALRGAAVVWMVAFHFCFDLSHFRFIIQDFYNDPFWTSQRSAIVSLFLFCAGLGQAVAHRQALDWPRFWKRWRQVAACALLVTAGSWWIFGPRFISFGVLHAVALMLLLARGALHAWPRLGEGRGPWLLVAVGAACIAAPWAFNHVFFDPRLTNWIGLTAHRPATEDYVPLLPWTGAMLFGLAAGLARLRDRPLAGVAQAPAGAMRWLAALGRHSLAIYMLHQPLFFGMLTGVTWLQR